MAEVLRVSLTGNSLPLDPLKALRDGWQNHLGKVLQSTAQRSDSWTMTAAVSAFFGPLLSVLPPIIPAAAVPPDAAGEAPGIRREGAPPVLTGSATHSSLSLDFR